MANPSTNEIRVKLPGSSAAIRLPAGWAPELESGHVVTVLSPERDLRVAFAASPVAGTPEEIAGQAWRLFDDGFDFPLLQKIQMPGSSGWDAICQIAYDVPAAQSRSALAILRVLRDKTYITLILGANGSLNRRFPQISELMEQWKPEGLSAPNLANSPRRMWEEEQSSEMADFLRSAMAEMHVPGTAIAVVQRGRIVFAEGFGLRKIGSSEQVRPETQFMIGSSTKPLTTLMMARLVAAGNFEWSTPVTKLLPDFALADAELTRRLEMWHTVSASTGMPRRDLDLVFKFKGVTPENRLAEMKEMKPTTDFGETFQYSNYLVAAGGYAAARSFLRQGSLEDAYERAMRESVFEPLGMKMTTFNDDGHVGAASPHAIDLGGNEALLDLVFEGFANAIAPSGAAWSTVIDMAQYLLLELNGGRLPTGEQFLPVEALEERWNGRIKISDKTSYGLGLFRSETEGLEVISHGGNTLGFSSDLYFLPKEEIGAVVLTNIRLANYFLAATRQKLFELLFDAPPKAEKMIASAAQTENEAVAGRLARVKLDATSVARLEKLAGDYESHELGPLSLRRKNSGYRVEFESWSSALGVEDQPNGDLLVVLTSPPWAGGLRLQVADEGRTLVLDGAQNVYRFERR
ncbi:MAG: serine hydrolase domain-containing protein [Rhizomicrobium sp.]